MSSDLQNQEPPTYFEETKPVLFGFVTILIFVQSVFFFFFDQLILSVMCNGDGWNWFACSYGYIILYFHLVTAATPFLLRPFNIFSLPGRHIRISAAAALLILALSLSTYAHMRFSLRCPSGGGEPVILSLKEILNIYVFGMPLALMHTYLAAINFMAAGFLLFKNSGLKTLDGILLSSAKERE